MTTIETERLILRHWQPQDSAPFCDMCADPTVMRFFPAPLSAEQALASLEKLQSELQQRGMGVFAVEYRQTGQFVGAVGLHWLENGFDFAPCVEAVWRIRECFWGQGLAVEAATACLKRAFDKQMVHEVVAMTAVLNRPSQRVMEKLGMQPEQDTFLHPNVAAGHALQEHVLYRLARPTVESAAELTAGSAT